MQCWSCLIAKVKNCNDKNLVFIIFRMQIEAHTGGVNDIAFAHPNKQLCVVTCGDDKLIKVSTKLEIPFCRPRFIQEKKC